MSKRDAMLLTFVLSALVHELVVAVLRREVRFVFFGFQLLQLVFMWVARYITELLGGTFVIMFCTHSFP